MAKKDSPKTAIVSSKELGTNCWITARFLKSLRCPRVMECTYPEKKTCEAVSTEIAYEKERILQVAVDARAKIKLLDDERIKGV